ncbi:MAG: carbamoyltransferase HypF [Pseudomonadota bacterium]
MSKPSLQSQSSMIARQLVIGGQVQGVGFRPYLYRLAEQYELTGWVENRQGAVVLQIEGEEKSVAAFLHALPNNQPPLADAHITSCDEVTGTGTSQFEIRESRTIGAGDIHLPPDHHLCDDCLSELADVNDRRYRYPFINCTQCGPRYTLIAALPYDRANTSMEHFPLCPSCRREYEDPADRRFHAEPIACPECGPQLEFYAGGESINSSEEALAKTVEQLRQGAIIAVKGVGGYHLLCDARNEKAIGRLRMRKPRPDKPLAVMFPAPLNAPLRAVEEELQIGEQEAEQLLDPARPIVLCRRRADSRLPYSIAPRLDEVGALLPYSPLHHLLLNDFNSPLIATSANLSGEPVIHDNREAQQRLAPIADGFLHHDRPILHPADDSIYRLIAGAMRPLRLGRGTAPLELELPFALTQPTLAVGGEMKNSITLGWGDRVVVPPHIGELNSVKGEQLFEQLITDLQQLYQVKPEVVVCDTHPGYTATRWAQASGLEVAEVLHHHAHASALYGEHLKCKDKDWLVFTWDGTGLGERGELWGGDALLGRPGQWQRFASLRPFRLPGGEQAGREPWRSALALCWESNRKWNNAPVYTGDQETELLRHAWQHHLNTPVSSSAGRLFDGAAALLGLCQQTSFEGQGPMWLESVAQKGGEPSPLPLERNENGLFISDWSPLLDRLLDNSLSVAERAGVFHATLAGVIVDQAEMARTEHNITTIGLCGGVFQNRLLTESTTEQLESRGFKVHLPLQLPCGDGGLSFGQIIEIGYKEP